MLPAKIFLQEERGHNENEYVRTYHTFNFGAYYNEYKTPFGSLYTLNDDTLAPQKEITVLTPQDSCVIIIPLVGTVSISGNTDSKTFLDAGQVFTRFVKGNSTLCIGNPMEEQLVNYLLIRVSVEGSVIEHEEIAEISLVDNVFYSLVNQRLTLSVGKFGGRKEGEYRVKKRGNDVFAFVIQGAFELENRLLQTRDGLALWDAETIELEALSNDAIILILDLKNP